MTRTHRAITVALFSAALLHACASKLESPEGKEKAAVSSGNAVADSAASGPLEARPLSVPPQIAAGEPSRDDGMHAFTDPRRNIRRVRPVPHVAGSATSRLAFMADDGGQIASRALADKAAPIT